MPLISELELIEILKSLHKTRPSTNVHAIVRAVFMAQQRSGNETVSATQVINDLKDIANSDIRSEYDKQWNKIGCAVPNELKDDIDERRALSILNKLIENNVKNKLRESEKLKEEYHLYIDCQHKKSDPDNTRIRLMASKAAIGTHWKKITKIQTIKLSNVPTLSPFFLGRDREIDDVIQSIKDMRRAENQIQVISAVHGWPGVGKTALTSALAYEKEIMREFKDGIIWIPLGKKPNLKKSLFEIASYLGDHEIKKLVLLREMSERLRRLLDGKQILIMLDDVWDVVPMQLFSNTIGEHNALLYTTRLPDVAYELDISNVYHLPVLDERHAIQLLYNIEPETRKYPNLVYDLIKAIECLPLMIHIVGRLIKEEIRLNFSVEELLEELTDVSQLLQQRVPSDMATTEYVTTPTVRAILKKSTEILPEKTKSYFATLSTFAPKPAIFHIDHLERLWKENPKPIVRDLVRRGLLEKDQSQEGAWFQIHSLLHTHAKELLGEE